MQLEESVRLQGACTHLKANRIMSYCGHTNFLSICMLKLIQLLGGQV